MRQGCCDGVSVVCSVFAVACFICLHFHILADLLVRTFDARDCKKIVLVYLVKFSDVFKKVCEAHACDG